MAQASRSDVLGMIPCEDKCKFVRWGKSIVVEKQLSHLNMQESIILSERVLKAMRTSGVTECLDELLGKFGQPLEESLQLLKQRFQISPVDRGFLFQTAEKDVVLTLFPGPPVYVQLQKWRRGTMRDSFLFEADCYKRLMELLDDDDDGIVG